MKNRLVLNLSVIVAWALLLASCASVPLGLMSRSMFTDHDPLLSVSGVAQFSNDGGTSFAAFQDSRVRIAALDPATCTVYQHPFQDRIWADSDDPLNLESLIELADADKLAALFSEGENVKVFEAETDKNGHFSIDIRWNANVYYIIQAICADPERSTDPVYLNCLDSMTNPVDHSALGNTAAKNLVGDSFGQLSSANSNLILTSITVPAPQPVTLGGAIAYDDKPLFDATVYLITASSSTVPKLHPNANPPDDTPLYPADPCAMAERDIADPREFLRSPAPGFGVQSSRTDASGNYSFDLPGFMPGDPDYFILYVCHTKADLASGFFYLNGPAGSHSLGVSQGQEDLQIETLDLADTP